MLSAKPLPPLQARKWAVNYRESFVASFIFSTFERLLAGVGPLREAMLTVGMLLIFTGALGATAASTLNTGPQVADPNPTFDSVIFGKMRPLQAVFVAEIIFTIIAFIGGALVLRNR